MIGEVSSAFDARDKRMFMISDNVQYYDRRVMLLVQSLVPGAVHELRSAQSKQMFIVGRATREKRAT